MREFLNRGWGSPSVSEKVAESQLVRWADRVNKGLSYFKITKRIRVVLSIPRAKLKHIGYFKTFSEAVTAYKEAFQQEFGTAPSGEYSESLFWDNVRSENRGSKHRTHRPNRFRSETNTELQKAE